MLHTQVAKSIDGFTLIEIVGVMVIIGLISSIGAAKVFDTDSVAKQAALDAAVIDLNGRERLLWSQIKLSSNDWITDAQVFASLDTHLGTEYHWSSLNISGGSLYFKGLAAALSRSASTSGQPAVWEIN